MEDLVIICECNSPEHQFILRKDDTDVYLEVHLSNSNTIWQRMVHAVKYVFGYKCKYGNFDAVLISERNKERIVKFLTNDDQPKNKLVN